MCASNGVEMDFAHRVLGDKLFDFSEAPFCIGADVGRFSRPSSIGPLNTNPVERAVFALEIGSHNVAWRSKS